MGPGKTGFPEKSMAISGIESMLQQLRALATGAADPAASANSAAPAGGAAPGGFASALQASLRDVSAAQNHANQEAQAFELGVPGVGLNDVMIDMQKANIGFQMSLQVRNKLVSAYTTISNMPV